MRFRPPNLSKAVPPSRDGDDFEPRCRENARIMLDGCYQNLLATDACPAIILCLRFLRDDQGRLTTTIGPGFSVTVGKNLPKAAARELLEQALASLDRGDWDGTLS